MCTAGLSLHTSHGNFFPSPNPLYVVAGEKCKWGGPALNPLFPPLPFKMWNAPPCCREEGERGGPVLNPPLSLLYVVERASLLLA